MDPKASVIIGLLDSVDIQQNSAAVAATIQTRVHVLQRQQVALEQRIASISPEVHRSLALPEASHPAADDHDEAYWFMKAMADTGLGEVQADLAHVLTYLSTELKELQRVQRLEEPQLEVSRAVIAVAHQYLLTDVGLTVSDLAASKPVLAPFGLPLAQIIWEARNHQEHVSRPFPHVVSVFQVLMSHRPALFGLASAPTQSQTASALKKRCWAVEVLTLLGWVSSRAVARDLLGIQK